MLFVILQIRSGAKLLKKWLGCNVPETATCADIYTLVSSGELDNIPLDARYNTVAVHTKAGRTATSEFIEVQANSCIKDIVSHLGVYLEFVVTTPNVENESSMQNKKKSCAFSLLMKSRNILPPSFDSTDNKNELLKFLEINEVGWTNDGVDVYGKQFFDVVGDCMWYLDGCHDTLKERCLGAPPPPEIAHISGFNQPEKHGHKRKTAESLGEKESEENSLAILHLTACSYKAPEWAKIREILLRLADNLRKYGDFLKNKKVKVQANHARLATAFFNDEKSHFQVKDAVISTNATLRARYKSISEKCASVEDEVISMNEFVPMGNPQGKYKFLKDLVVPARHVRYTHSTRKLNLDFIWKVPTDDSVEDTLNKSGKLTDELKKQIPVYHTRAMRRDFINCFGMVCNTKNPVLREMYRRLTGDSSSATNTKEAKVDQR